MVDILKQIWWIYFIITMEEASGALLTISPNRVTLGSRSNTKLLSFECKLTNEYPYPVRMTLFRRRSSERDFTPLVLISSNNSAQYALNVPTDISERTTVLTGTLVPEGDRSVLKLELNESLVRCSDEADYRCTGLYFTGKTITREDVKHLTTEALPKSLMLSASKNGTGVTIKDSASNTAKFNVGDVATFNCSGDIGSDKSLKILWQVSSMTEDTFLPHTDNVEDGVVSSQPINCQYSLTSNMAYNITQIDATRKHGLKIRCYLDKTEHIQSNVYYIDLFDPHINDTTVPSTTATLQTTTAMIVNETASSTATATVPVLAAVVGILVGVILVLGVCLWNERRHKTGTDESSNVTYVNQLNTLEPGSNQLRLATNPAPSGRTPSTGQAEGDYSQSYDNSPDGPYQELDNATRAGNMNGPVYQELDTTTRAGNMNGPVYQKLDTTTRAGNMNGPVYQELDTTTRAGNMNGPVYQELDNATGAGNMSGPVYQELDNATRAGNMNGLVYQQLEGRQYESLGGDRRDHDYGVIVTHQ